MNILISAYSCNPYKGSEDAVGWNWIVQYSRNANSNDRIYVITKKYNEEAMLKGIKEYKLENVTLWISEPPVLLDWFREKNSTFHHMYYTLWQKWAYLYVKRKKVEFDIIHHVTMTDWRFVGYFSNFENAYTIFGPVGGGQEVPKALKPYQTKKIMEIIRSIANRTRKWIPSYVRRLNRFDAIYCVNEETKDFIEKIVHEKNKVFIEQDCAIADQYREITLAKNKDYSEHRLLFTGRYDLPRKGAFFLVDALAKLPKTFKYSLDMYGGSSDDSLQKKIDESELSSYIHLKGKLAYSDMKGIYTQYDAFVFPSIRETGGNVLIEAMTNGLPIIGFNTSVNRVLNKRNCGIFIEPDGNLNEIQQEFADAVKDVFSNNYKAIAKNAYAFSNEQTWEKKYMLIMHNYNNHK